MLSIAAGKVVCAGRTRSGVVGVAVMLVMLFGAGCGPQGSDQGSAQDQALKEEQQENKELQEQLEAQQEEEAQEEEAAKQEEMQQQIEDLEQQVEEQESEPQGTDEPEQQSDPQPADEDSPDVVIQNGSIAPSQAPEGVVVVSSDYNVGAVTTEEAEVINAAIDYYQYAEMGDYYTTHSLLSTDDQAFYPVDTWVAANTTLDSAAGEFVVADAYPEDIGNGYPTYAVTLTVYLPDGSASPRKTYFTNEGNGYWAHWLTEEEMGLFNSAL